MRWIASYEKETDAAALERRLWNAVDWFRANSGLKSQAYSFAAFGMREGESGEPLTFMKFLST